MQDNNRTVHSAHRYAKPPCCFVSCLCVSNSFSLKVQKVPNTKMPEVTNVYFFENMINLTKLTVIFQTVLPLYFFEALLSEFLKNFYCDSFWQFVISKAVYFRRRDGTLWNTIRGKGTSPFLTVHRFFCSRFLSVCFSSFLLHSRFYIAALRRFRAGTHSEQAKRECLYPPPDKVRTRVLKRAWWTNQ